MRGLFCVVTVLHTTVKGKASKKRKAVAPTPATVLDQSPEAPYSPQTPRTFVYETPVASPRDDISADDISYSPLNTPVVWRTTTLVELDAQLTAIGVQLDKMRDLLKSLNSQRPSTA